MNTEELNNRIKYLEKQFNHYYDRFNDVNTYLYHMNMGVYHEEDIDIESLRFSEYWTVDTLKQMYNILCVYFETLQLDDYLNEFKIKYKDLFDDTKKLLNFISIPFRGGDYDENFEIIYEWQNILAPFDFFWKKKSEEINMRIYKFLSSTQEFLKITKTHVRQENDIISVMKEMAELTFNDVHGYSESYFRHNFKYYIPDIIINEFNAAIEFKLIRKNNEIETKLDELIIDAKRYTGNPDNKECYAVFCMSKTVTKTKEIVVKYWKKLDFPDNWRFIIISDIDVLKRK